MENIGYNFQHGIGVPVDYAKARSWLYRAAALENSDAENQLGWMYQFGQGVEPDDARAVAWYSLAADQGNTQGKNNLCAFQEELEERGSGLWESANQPVSDAAIEMVRRRVRIRELRAQITGLETDAVQDDNSADELATMGKKDDGVGKVMDAFGTVVGVKPRLDAAKYREQAARLREELARLESLDQSSANVCPLTPRSTGHVRLLIVVRCEQFLGAANWGESDRSS